MIKFIFFIPLLTILFCSNASATLLLQDEANPFQNTSLEKDNDALFASFKHIEQKREEARLLKEKNLKIKREQEQKQEEKRLALEKKQQQKQEEARKKAKIETENISKKIAYLTEKIELEKSILLQKKNALLAKESLVKKITVHIDLSDQRISVYRGKKLQYKWRVSTARRGYVTPTGTYKPLSMQRMHYSKKYHNSPMPFSIFFKGGYALHGTKSISRLGRIASHGCVRLHPTHAHTLYDLIKEYGKENTTIRITP